MILLALAVALPRLFWDAAPDTAPALRESGITHIFVPAAAANDWKNAAGITAETADPRQAIKLLTPAVNYRYDQASASRAPWLDANGWKFLRQPQARFYYEAPGPRAALAAAEAFAWGANALIKTDTAGLKPMAEILDLVRGLENLELRPVVDLGFVDDRTAVAGEVMNLLVRNNLLFRIVRAPEPALKLTVQLGAKNYPLDQAKNPAVMAHMIRGDLTDDRRSLRIYGTAVVLARLESASGRLRVHLINYDAARKVSGIRVRVLGEYARHRLATAGNKDAALLDYAVVPGATEFTLPELKTYAVIDLFR